MLLCDVTPGKRRMVLGEGAATHLCPVRGGAGAGTGCGSPVAKVSGLWPPPGMSSSKLTLGLGFSDA